MIRPIAKQTTSGRKRQKAFGRALAGNRARDGYRHLGLEPLENRRLLTTIAVTTTNQEVNSDGNTSLQEAIFSANFDKAIAIDPTNLSNFITTAATPGSGADTIVLQSGATYQMSSFVQDQYNQTGTTANPAIFSNITIDANGATLVRSGAKNIRAFSVVDLNTDITVDNNGTPDPADDVIIPVGTTGSLTIRNAHIQGFKIVGGAGTDGGGGGLGAGGAIYLKSGSLTLVNCTFDGNSVTGGAGSSPTSGDGGGGGGGLTGAGGIGGMGGGGGAGARGDGGNGGTDADGTAGGGGGGGTANTAVVGSGTVGGNGGFNGGGKGGDPPASAGSSGFVQGGGGGGGASNSSGAGGGGGAGNYGSAGGGGGAGTTTGGAGANGGFGGGGGGGGVGLGASGGNGGAGGFGAGGGGAGVGPVNGSAGAGGLFAGSASGTTGGGGGAVGAAIFNDSGVLTILNSTFFGNTTTPGVGPGAAEDGTAFGQVFSRNGSTGIFNSTFSNGNSLDVAVAGDGSLANLTLDNTILANNTLGAANGQVFSFNGGSVSQSNVGNLVEVNGAASPTTAPIAGVVSSADPQLLPLVLNAPGITPTMGIPVTSPAINAADFGTSLSTDQRGVSRPQGFGSDIGAFERQVQVPDAFEPNNTIGTATVLGSLPEVTLRDLTIHDPIQRDGGIEIAQIVDPADEDFFQITAHDTGKLLVTIHFTNADGNLDLQVVDARGNVLGSSTSTDDDELVTIPVVGQQRYYVHVFGVAGSTNSYALEIENFAAPPPAEVDLDVADDSGSSFLDNDTFRTTQVHYYVHADLADFAAEGIAILTAAQAAAGVTPGAAVQVFDNGVPVGFANVVAGTNNTIFDVRFDHNLVNLSIGGPNAAGPAGYLGFTNFITAAVRMFDGQKNSVGAPTPATGRTQLSDPLRVVADNTAPVAPTGVFLLPSSDSGVTGDGITDIDPPAIGGVGETNTKVVVRANGIQVGVGVVGTDASDGVLGNGLGTWEVTTEPLALGIYSITATLEDLAGNIGAASTQLTLVIDTLKPQRPTIDLVDAFDTGSSDLDNVTNLTTLNFRVSAEPGTTVVIKDGNTVIDTFVMPAVAFTTRTISWPVAGIAAEGPHPLSAEATDAAGNRSEQSTELLVTIDTIVPASPSIPDLLASSDTGSFNNDNVTNLQALAFQGTGQANDKVRIRANGVVVGQGIVGTDLTNPPAQLPNSPPAIGAWELTTEPLSDGTYTITAEIEDLAGNISVVTETLTVTIDTIAPNLPYLDLTAASDTGRNNVDNLTRDNTPTVTTTADDVQGAGLNLSPHDVRYRIFDRLGNGPDVLLVNSFITIPGLSTLNFFTDTLPVLADGVHNLKLEVEDRAGNVSHAFLLQVTIDTASPPVFFGLAASATDGLDPASDSGVIGDQASLTDRITNVTRPSFFGTAEANAIVHMFVDLDGNPNTTGDQRPLGQSVAIPLDGNLAYPNGQWNLTSILELNDPSFFPHDGIRHIFVTAEDPAGNGSSTQQLDIFLDTQGPQVTNVSIPSSPDYNLFGLKPNNAFGGPTPLVNDLQIDLRDLPIEDATFLRNAIEAGVASTPGLITLVGDHNGVIKIDSITVTNNPPVAGQIASASIVLHFNTALPDDRYTLTVGDGLPDVAGNKLDGENNAVQPTDFPLFPSGDGQPGGDFVARFTVDSRPELGTYAAANVFIDANGNFVSDPQGQNNDFTNRDLTFSLGIVPALNGTFSPMGIHDSVFAGNFPRLVPQEEGPTTLRADGFDKLAAYGSDPIAGGFRWLIDTNNDGIIDTSAGDFATKQPAGFQINGLPIAGNFDGNLANGAEIGLFDGTKWYFDTNLNHVIDSGELTVTTSLRGLPIVGDFNGDGVIDLATWKDDKFYFNFGTQPGGIGTQPAWSGAVDATINWGLPGVSELPIAADMDGDGITDVGLYVQARTGTLPLSSGNWQFLISNDFTHALRGGKQVTALNHPFSPAPLGNDLFAQFGDAFALPIVGNFDPPAATSQLPAATPLANVLGTVNIPSQSLSGDKWYTFQSLRAGTISVDAAATVGIVNVNLYSTSYALMGSASAAAVGHMVVSQNISAGETYMLRLSGTGSTASLKISNQVPDADRLDTTRDGSITAADALRVISELLTVGGHATPTTSGDPKLYFDTNLDGRISTIDALQVISYLLKRPAAPHTALPTATLVSSTASAVDAAVASGLAIGASAAPAAAPAAWVPALAAPAGIAPAPADAVYAQMATSPTPLLADDDDSNDDFSDEDESADIVAASWS
jgi:hypothetical protein